jgi:hypothetical protein
MDVLPTLPLGLDLLNSMHLDRSGTAEAKALGIEGDGPSTTKTTGTGGPAHLAPRPPPNGPPKGGLGGAGGGGGVGPGGAAGMARSTRLTPADGPGPGRPGR